MRSGLVSSRFGTVRGLVRLMLAHGEVLSGLGGIRPCDPDAVQRLVFVCHGNICRSAYAEALAHEAGLAAISFGLSTTSGKPAHPPLAALAVARGHDLSSHRATAQDDYEPREGDLLLAMETRHLRLLARHPRLGSLPRTLLGIHASPSVPHLHDPYRLSDAYMLTCLRRIESTIPALNRMYPGAVVGTPPRSYP